MGKLIVVAGGQFGSEGKGAVAASLAARHEAHSIRVGGPNAGHTVYDHAGKEWKLQQVPAAAVTVPGALMIGSGSEIDPDILDHEVKELDAAGFRVSSRLQVDVQATILWPKHASLETAGLPHGEAGITREIGSTGKGVGAARAERIWRKAILVGNEVTHHTYFGPVWHGLLAGDTARLATEMLTMGESILIEGTQGYGLGLHAGYYPFCTSGDCRAIDFLAQAGLSPWQVLPEDLEVWIVLRSFPIRVAGNSGPLFAETDWNSIGQPTEYTTVTKKPRRVGGWDPELARKAIAANGGRGRWLANPVRVALTFLDYVFPSLRDCDDIEKIFNVAGPWLEDRENEIGAPIRMVGTGPNTLVSLEVERA